MRQTLLFDLDGTISDPAIGFCRSVNYALVAFGYPAMNDAEIARHIGPPIEDTFRSVTGSNSQNHVLALVRKYRERYGDIGWSENVIYPGIPEALECLVNRGLLLGVCTTKRADFAAKILTKFGLRDYFEVLSGGDVGISKVSQLADLLAQGLVSSDSTMIGDRAIDVTAARSNGLKSVGVLWGYGTPEELREAAPHTVLSAPKDLIELAEDR